MQIALSKTSLTVAHAHRLLRIELKRDQSAGRPTCSTRVDFSTFAIDRRGSCSTRKDRAREEGTSVQETNRTKIEKVDTDT